VELTKCSIFGEDGFEFCHFKLMGVQFELGDIWWLKLGASSTLFEFCKAGGDVFDVLSKPDRLKPSSRGVEVGRLKLSPKSDSANHPRCLTKGIFNITLSNSSSRSRPPRQLFSPTQVSKSLAQYRDRMPGRKSSRDSPVFVVEVQYAILPGILLSHPLESPLCEHAVTRLPRLGPDWVSLPHSVWTEKVPKLRIWHLHSNFDQRQRCLKVHRKFVHISH
jgi:hypothetical protein